MKNIFLYFSAFIPMYLLVLVNFFIEFINKNIRFNVLNITILTSMSAFIILGTIGLLWNTKWNKDESKEIKIISKQNTTDEHFLGYFALFVLFALSFELTKISMFVVSLLIIVMIGIVYVNNKMFYINPLLNILGFNFYEIEFVVLDDSSTSESQNPRTAKIFYRGTIEIGNIYKVKLKNENFSFLEKQ